MNEKKIVASIIGIAALLLGAAWWANTHKNSDQTNPSEPTQAQLDAREAATQDTSNTHTMDTVTKLTVTDTVVGTGKEAQDGDTVFMLYTGTLTNGQVFDASSLHGNEPFSFQLGAGRVIQGWDIGVKGMKEGGKRHFIIPADLAYGARAIGSIPANSTLIFDVELVKVVSAK